MIIVASAVSLSRSFHWGIVWGGGVKEFLCAVVDARMHLNLYGCIVVHASAEMRDEVGTML